MTDVETLTERVRTVERAVTDGDHDFPAVDELAELTDRLDRIERRLDDLEERTGELEAATQALRGYVGNVRSVNERVEQRADTALATAERLERRLDADDSQLGPSLRETADERASTAGPSESGASVAQRDSAGSRSEPTGRPTGNQTTSIQSEDQSTDEAGADPGVLERIQSLL